MTDPLTLGDDALGRRRGRRIAAMVPNRTGFSPGQRIRIESWIGALEAAGWIVDLLPFEDDRLHEVLYRPGRAAAKVGQLARCYWRHWRRVASGIKCDVLFIYREAALIGPAFLERLAARTGAPVVYDIDDPVFLPYRSPVNGWFSRLKCAGKTHSLFRLANRVISINRLIGDYAARFNPNVTVIPNAVDTDHFRPAAEMGTARPFRIVWTGSHTTMPNLGMVAEPLRRIQREIEAPLRVIGVGSPDLPGVDFEMRQWSADSEVSELQSGEVGIVPVPDQPWNRWKLFLKLVQYMAIGLPVVASRIGSNSEIIQDGVNGFLADSPGEWHDRIRLLADRPDLRRRMGAAARETAEREFSLQTQSQRVVKVFEDVARLGKGQHAASCA